MENIVLSIHLILTLCLIGAVLLQRSEGGGLGMGGGDGAVSGRGAANAMTKLTWMLAIGFLITSVALTIIAAKNAGEGSVLDRLGLNTPVSATSTLTPDLGNVVLTPPSATDAPTAPPASE
ncbi:MAG: preprotein translocase subunit SecG [Paracoccaceae bacterium]